VFFLVSFCMIQYNTIQYNTIQYNTIQYNTIQYNTLSIPYHTYNILQYNIIQYISIVSSFIMAVGYLGPLVMISKQQSSKAAAAAAAACCGYIDQDHVVAVGLMVCNCWCRNKDSRRIYLHIDIPPWVQIHTRVDIIFYIIILYH
jgi:hypothetical protein